MKGITPVIAMILLLLITISLVGIGYVAFQRTAQTATNAGDTEMQNTLQSTGVPSIESVNKNQVYLRSVGGAPLINPTFFVAGKKVDATGPATLAPGALGTYVLSEAQLSDLPPIAEVKVTTGGFSDSIIATLRDFLAKIFTAPVSITGMVIGQGEGIAFQNSTGNTIAVMTDDGKMGIGTTTPGALLDVKGASTGRTLLGVMSDSTGYGAMGFQSTLTSANYAVAGNSVYTLINAPTGAPITFNINNAEKMRVNSDGKVGIGTASPAQLLSVAGTIESTTGGFKFPDGTTQTTAGAGGSQWTTSGQNIYFNNGNVGIWTTTPVARLDIRSSQNSGTLINYQAASPVFIVDKMTGFKLDLNTNYSNPMGYGPIEGMLIALPSASTINGQIIENGLRITAGPVGMGSSGASNFTGISINMPNITQTAGSLTSMGIAIKGGTVTSGTSYALVTDAAAGNVGIGTTTPARKLHVSDAMRLQPIVSPPASPSQGDLYFDTSDALCVYVTAGWAKIAGSGTCA